MKRILLYLNLFFSPWLTICAQENPTPSTNPAPPYTNNQQPAPPKDFSSFKERLYVGGNIGAWFGTTTYLNISPLIGCRITKKFSIGGGATYNYYSQTYAGKKYVSTIYGGNGFARYLILENLFAQVGLDRLSVEDYTSPIPNSRVWVNNILLGGGYRQPFSERGSFVIAVFYNINQTPLSPYPNPIVQIGFNIGL